ncbi:MAG: carbohydrate binding domain-containing protein [Candidatus Sumerlaeota bacterium]|nr:carbohydrate binding domain-containing protein [Candidatus Sumerlaeota bacterium]
MEIRVLWNSLMPCALLALLVQTALGQIIVNGDFSDGLRGWSLSQQEGAKAEASVAESGAQTADQAARIQIVIPKQPQRLQFGQKFEAAKLEPGKQCELTFRARGEEPTSFPVLIIKAAAPYGSLGLRAQANVGPEWQTFRFPFRAAANDQPFGRLVFMLGQSKGTVWLDDVRIQGHERVALKGGGPVLDDAAWRPGPPVR